MKLDNTTDISLNKHIDNYIITISKKYNISVAELKKLWKEHSAQKDLKKESKATIVKMCEEFDIDTKGKTKSKLIELLTKYDSSKLKNEYKVVISKNQFGNYVHEPSQLVFNRSDKVVIGKQLPGGEIIQLTLEDIDICNKHKFEYQLPDNLNASIIDEDDCNQADEKDDEDDLSSYIDDDE